jgi:4-alpha-glucanotransferase
VVQLARAGGVLLHPTSLPSRYGIGDLGQEARDFVDFLAESNLRLWQVLPLNPIGFGESPYQSFSAFAGSPLFISLDELRQDGLVSGEQLKKVPSFPEEKVAYQACAEYKERIFRQAYASFLCGGKDGEKGAAYRCFVEKNSYWLADYALFMALKRYFHNVPWNFWEKEIALRQPAALKRWESMLAAEIDYQIFLQYEFFRQWHNFRQYASAKGISLIGDLPIYVAYDSSDTWVNPRLFELDELGNPLKVGGVPPDYFSATGQLWGNPIYKWRNMAENDYLWWRERIKVLLELVDYIRIDHFRGFEAYWEIPGGELTAVNGRWVKGPAENFFQVITAYLGELPLIAEDLGIITPAVVELKNKFGFPGMKVLQFVDRESITERPLPGPEMMHTAETNYVYYTGTHDNNTLRGWFEKKILAQLNKESREKWDQVACEKICWEFIETVMQSRAKWAIVPLQDFLCLGSSARMNQPGTVGGNWEWRCKKGALTGELARRISALVTKCGR